MINIKFLVYLLIIIIYNLLIVIELLGNYFSFSFKKYI